jgi:hypothetical protein
MISLDSSMVHCMYRLPVVTLMLITSVAQGREWHDASGTYQIEADLFAFDDENVVFQRSDHELGLLTLLTAGRHSHRRLAAASGHQAMIAVKRLSLFHRQPSKGRP